MNWLRGLSIRTRLTLGTLAVAFVVSLAAGLLLHANVESITRSTTIDLLKDDAAPIEATIRATPTSPKLSAGEGQLVLVVSPTGAIALSNLPDALLDETRKLEHLGSTPKATVISNDHRSYLVMGEFVGTAGGRWRIVVARNLEPGALVVSRLGITYVIGGGALFLLLGLTSWILSGAALRPVGRMRAEAQRLGDATASGQLPVGPARDELAALATTLNELIDRNRASVERERQMISDASHELRTPLAVLIAQLDAATAAEVGDGTYRVRQARETALRLSRLATNLLELSSLESRRNSAASPAALLANEFTHCVDRARTLAEDREIVVDFDLRDGDAAARYPIEASDFGRLVDNLLANAIAASPRAGVVSAEFATDGGELTVSITDRGTGMPAEFIPVAFDRFTRPEGARARTSGGSGLGLAIVAAIVASAGGTISITNQEPGVLALATIPESTARPRG